MMATMAVKFLRDGVDSANSLANQGLDAQASYNFFAESLFTNLKDSGEGFANEVIDDDVCQAIRPHTNFCASLGSSDMAEYD